MLIRIQLLNRYNNLTLVLSLVPLIFPLKIVLGLVFFYKFLEVDQIFYAFLIIIPRLSWMCKDGKEFQKF